MTEVVPPPGWSRWLRSVTALGHRRCSQRCVARSLEGWLATHPATDVGTPTGLEAEQQRLRIEQPLVPDDSVDVVVSNCVLNLVAPEHKQRLFAEIFPVLRRGDRAVISDIVSVSGCC